jgi:hypothetical protein
MTVTDPAGPRYAHELVERPSGFDYLTPGTYADDLPRRLAVYHTVHAAGFYRGVDAASWSWPEGVTCLMYEYQLAFMWFQMARAGQPDPAALSRHLLTEMVSPQVIGGTLLAMLRWAGIPASAIRPYEPSSR